MNIQQASNNQVQIAARYFGGDEQGLMDDICEESLDRAGRRRIEAFLAKQDQARVSRVISEAPVDPVRFL